MTCTDRRYASFGVRVAASLLDSLWMGAFSFVLGFGIYAALGVSAQDPRALAGVDFTASFLAPLLLVIVVWRLKQTTPGKAVFGCRIVDARTGTAPTIAQCIIRYLGYIPSVLPFGLGLIWVAFDPRRQGWHDKLARTVVVVQDIDGHTRHVAGVDCAIHK